jgi:hypothetical protein
MTRSHALLHCPNATLAAARVEAWEGRNPSGIRALLSDPRWESRLLRFLELSGVGRYVEGGVDEDQTHAERMAEWIVWEMGQSGTRARNRHQNHHFLFSVSFFLSFFCKGTHTPRLRTAHAGSGGFLLLWLARRGGGRFLLS